MQTLSRTGYLYLCGIRLSSSVVLWLDFILIFTTLTFTFNASASSIALAASLYGLPALFLGPYLGSLADRFDPGKILAVGFFARFLTALALFSASSVELFLTFTALKGLANLGSTSAEVVLTRRLLADAQIVKNNSIVTVMDQIVKVLSPLVAGLLTSLTFKSSGFLLSAIFSIAGIFFIIILISMRRELMSAHAAARQQRTTSFYSFFSDHPGPRLFLLCLLIQAGALGLYDSMLGLLLKELGHGSAAFGMIVSFTAVGGITAGVIFPKVYALTRFSCCLFSTLLFGSSITAVGLISFYSIPAELILFSFFFTTAGVAYGLTSQGFTTTLQINCPRSSLGSIFATTRSLSIALFITCPILGGWLAGFTNISTVLLTAGSATVMLALVLWILNRAPTSD